METEEERDTRLRNKWLTRFATELEKFTVMMEKDKSLRADPELTLDILLNAGVVHIKGAIASVYNYKDKYAATGVKHEVLRVLSNFPENNNWKTLELKKEE